MATKTNLTKQPSYRLHRAKLLRRYGTQANLLIIELSGLLPPDKRYVALAWYLWTANAAADPLGYLQTAIAGERALRRRRR